MTFLRKLLSFIKCRFLGYVPLNKVVSVEIDKTVTSTKDAAWGSPLILEDKKMNKPTCESCVYFLLIYKESKTGECFKNAPVVTDGPKISNFPVTQAHKWCGEHPDFPAYLESLKTPPAQHPETKFEAGFKCKSCGREFVDVVSQDGFCPYCYHPGGPGACK